MGAGVPWHADGGGLRSGRRGAVQGVVMMLVCDFADRCARGSRGTLRWAMATADFLGHRDWLVGLGRFATKGARRKSVGAQARACRALSNGRGLSGG